MGYTDRDQSVEDGNPLLLFQFAQGATVYRYALASESVYHSLEGHTWTAAIMVPSEFGQSNDVGKDTLKVELAANDALAATLTPGTLDTVTTLTVFRTFTNPVTTLETYWKGRVQSVGMEPGKVVLNCEPVFTQLKRPGLRALYTKMCRHVLYGRGCNLSSTSFRYSCTVFASSGNVITLPAATALDGYWDGGILTAPDGTSRMITRHSGGKLYLIRAIKSLNDYITAHPLTGASVYLFRGCDHTYAMCKARFNNAGNYGGDPYFAQKNPFTTQVSFV